MFPRCIALEITDDAKTHLVRAGSDPAYGARPLTSQTCRPSTKPRSERRRTYNGAPRNGAP
jgi:ClpA/ClpB-like protein